MKKAITSRDASFAFALFAILHAYSWWHLGRLRTLECLQSCNANLERYRTVLRVEMGLILFSTAFMAYTAQCPDGAMRMVAPVTKSPRAIVITLFALFAAILAMHVVQLHTLRTLRRCACVRESDVDLATTLIAGERMLKILIGVVSVAALIMLTRRLASAGRL
jgi:hypothetical protein